MKFKLHIQLEPFNGKKFDFIEFESENIEVDTNFLKNIDQIYQILKNNKDSYKNENFNQEAKYDSGKSVMSKDKKILTEKEWLIYKTKKDITSLKNYPWNFDYIEIKKLVNNENN